MAATTTLAPPPVCHDVTHVAIEDDASPVVRLLGRTLRDAARCGHAEEELSATGVVAVRSHDTPQAATIVFGAGTVSVTGGVLVEPDATLVVDLNARFAPAQDPTGDTDLAGAVLRALNPPLPTWRDAAARFWELTRSISGIPDVLVVEADGPGGRERGRYGEGGTDYLLSGPADLLAGVFAGADDLLVSLSRGVCVKGTLSQLSVMTAASWKVRFDV